MIVSDLSMLDHKYRAKRSGQSRVEYAASVEVYRRPGKNLWAPVFALLLIGAAVFTFWSA